MPMRVKQLLKSMQTFLKNRKSVGRSPQQYLNMLYDFATVTHSGTHLHPMHAQLFLAALFQARNVDENTPLEIDENGFVQFAYPAPEYKDTTGLSENSTTEDKEQALKQRKQTRFTAAATDGCNKRLQGLIQTLMSSQKTNSIPVFIAFSDSTDKNRATQSHFAFANITWDPSSGLSIQIKDSVLSSKVLIDGSLVPASQKLMLEAMLAKESKGRKVTLEYDPQTTHQTAANCAFYAAAQYFEALTGHAVRFNEAAIPAIRQAIVACHEQDSITPLVNIIHRSKLITNPAAPRSADRLSSTSALPDSKTPLQPEPTRSPPSNRSRPSHPQLNGMGAHAASQTDQISRTNANRIKYFQRRAIHHLNLPAVPSSPAQPEQQLRTNNSRTRLTQRDATPHPSLRAAGGSQSHLEPEKPRQERQRQRPPSSSRAVEPSRSSAGQAQAVTQQHRSSGRASKAKARQQSRKSAHLIEVQLEKAKNAILEASRFKGQLLSTPHSIQQLVQALEATKNTINHTQTKNLSDQLSCILTTLLENKDLSPEVKTKATTAIVKAQNYLAPDSSKASTTTKSSDACSPTVSRADSQPETRQAVILATTQIIAFIKSSNPTHKKIKPLEALQKSLSLKSNKDTAIALVKICSEPQASMLSFFQAPYGETRSATHLFQLIQEQSSSRTDLNSSRADLKAFWQEVLDSVPQLKHQPVDFGEPSPQSTVSGPAR